MSLIAPELNQIPLSAELTGTLARASEHASNAGAPEVSLEHLLLALVEDPDAAAVLEASAVDAAILRAHATDFIARNQALGVPPPPGTPLSISSDVRRILEAAAAAARGGRRRDINGAILLAAIVGDGRSVAAEMLQAQGLTFESAIRALQAAMSQRAARERAATPAAADDVLAEARARVQSRAAPTLRDIMADKPRPQPPPAMPPIMAPSTADRIGLPPLPAIEDAPVGTPATPPFASDAFTPPSAPHSDGGAGESPPPAAEHDKTRDDEAEIEAEETAQASWQSAAAEAEQPVRELAEPAPPAASQTSAVPEQPGPPSWVVREAQPSGKSSQGEAGAEPPFAQPAAPATGPAVLPEAGSPLQQAGRPDFNDTAQPAPQPASHNAPAREAATPPPPAYQPQPSAARGPAERTWPEAWREAASGSAQPLPPPPGFGPPVSPPNQPPAAHPMPAPGYAPPLGARTGSVDARPPAAHRPPPIPPRGAPSQPPAGQPAPGTFGPGQFSSNPSPLGRPLPDAPRGATPPLPGGAGQQPSARRHDPALPMPPIGPMTAGPPGHPAGAPPLAPAPSPAPSPAPAPAAKRARPAPKTDAGELAENIPRVMRVGDTERVEVRIARGALEALTENLDGGGVAWRHAVTVTQAMSVRMRAPDGGFFIESASPETQWIESQRGMGGDDYASWRFLITPNARGRGRLQIFVSARTVGADGVAAETALPDQIVDVKVRTNVRRSLGRLAGWAMAAIIGGVLARFGDGLFDIVRDAISRTAG